MARYRRFRPKAVVPLSDQSPLAGRKDAQLGTLARSLASVERLGVVVPETWVILADVFRHVVSTSLPAGHDPGSLLRTIRRPIGVERAARARDRLTTVPLDVEIEREIDGAFRALEEVSPWGIAVRASAILPDAGIASAAGLSQTELAVFGREELGRALRRIWARASSEETLRYLRGRRVREVALAVVLQPVIVARANATVLTDTRAAASAPSTEGSAGPHRLVVTLPGLGCAAADQSLSEVSIIDGSGGFHLVRELGSAKGRIVRGSMLREDARSPPPEPLAASRSSEFAEIARRLEPLGSVSLRSVIPERGEITVVDVRPVSHQGHPGAGTAQTLWARAEAGETPAAPLSPLSRDLLSGAVMLRLRRFVGDGKRGASRGEASLALVSGRPMLDLSRVVEASGAYDVDRAARIEIAGAQLSPDETSAPRVRTSLARAGLRIAQMAAEQRVLADDVARFERDAETERRWLSEMDLAILPDDALTTTLHEVSSFLDRANDLHARATVTAVSGHALLASTLSNADPVRASFLAHAVTAGADVITARPSAALCHVAAIARYDEVGSAWLGQRPTTLAAMPEGALSRAIRRFLEAFGDRSIAEAELATPRWAEEPAPILAVLDLLGRESALDPDLALSRARALADRELALLEPRLSFFETRLVRDIVSRVRDFLRLRERCRVRVAHALSMMRVVSLDVDRRIRRLDPALVPGDAFSLTRAELGSAVSKYRADLAPIVRARREDLARDAQSPGPPPVFRGAPPPELSVPTDRAVRGIAASPGAVDGRVAKLGEGLEGLSRFSPGDVLVVRSLDLGLAPLAVHAGAVIAELGTPFSSSAVVARDFGVPVVSGVPAAFELFRDGDRVHVDGTSGVVERVTG